MHTPVSKFTIKEIFIYRANQIESNWVIDSDGDGLDMAGMLVSNINDYRTERYRVFIASSYFNIDLKEEISWNKEHIKKLKAHKDNPHKFHKERTDGPVTDQRMRHFQEHVIDAIPFHEKLVSEHEARLKAIHAIMPKGKYDRIVRISMKHGGTPDYFVYDKTTKEFFFVAERMTPERKEWIELVRNKHKLADVHVIG